MKKWLRPKRKRKEITKGMTIENVTVETANAYEPSTDEERFTSTSYEVLRLTVPLPGGKASYEIRLPNGMKANLEYAATLAKTKS